MVSEDMPAGIADPFATVEFNPAIQTGADWYRLALSASYGGKTIHGLNATPSFEVLAKQTEVFSSRYATGRIKHVATERAIPAMGPSITDRPYTLKGFKGVRSRAGTFFAFDQGLWEPSGRKRAREASILAASIAAHTGNQAEACKIVAKITSDCIDERAVEVANIPISHMKRDVILLSKPTHMVFSCGTIQRSIRWEDDQLLTEKLPEVAAVDWGRVTAIARYIAEANLQLDPSFRSYAMRFGVPYALVSGCWAHVAFGDYVLDVKSFDGIPSVTLGAYKIPTLAMAYEHAADSLMRQCYLNLNKLAYSDEAPDAARLLTILEGCKMKLRGTIPRQVGWTETEVLAAPTSHAIDANAARRFAASSATAYNALIEACNQVLRDSPQVLRLARIVASNSKMNRDDPESVDRLTKALLTNATWTIATSLLETGLSSRSTAEIRMARLKRTTFGFSGALAQKFTITTAMAKTARATTMSVAKRALLTQPRSTPKYNPFTELRAMIGSHAVATAARAAISNLETFKESWVERYEEWVELFAANPNPAAHAWMLKYKAASTAFSVVNATTVVSIHTRFIISGSPTASYLYRFALKMASEMNIANPKLSQKYYPSAIDLAMDLDNLMVLDVPFIEIEAFVYSKLLMLAGDFGISEDSAVRNEEASAVGINATLTKQMVGKVMVWGDSETIGKVDQLTALFASNTGAIAPVSYDAVLSSYDTVALANAHARANGYKDFDVAFNSLGEKARFDLASEYTAIGVGVIQAELTGKDDGMILG